MIRLVTPDHERRIITRRDVLRGATGFAAGGALALVTVRGGRFSAIAQDATPAAGTDVDAYPEVIYTGQEYRFHGPAEVTGGLTRITFRNEGHMDHHAMLVKFNEGKSAADLPAALAQGLPGLFTLGVAVGGPGTVGPGLESSVIHDLADGNYVLICLIPDEDGIPHVAKGMALPLTVSGAAAVTAPAPQPDATIALMDFHFMGLPATVTPGAHLWEVTNQGQQLHELALFQLAPGMTFDQFQAILSASETATPMAGMEGTPMAAQEGPPPFVSFGGLAPASPGASGWVVLDLAAGEYAAACFVPDTESGAPHFALGMISPLTVG